jgi:hypothetical protein
VTDSMIPPPPPKADQPGALEDLIDIFTAPSKVFERRAKGGAAAAFFILAIAMGALSYTAKNVMAPPIEAQMAKAMEKARAKNPQMTEEAMQTALGFQKKTVPISLAAGPVFIILGSTLLIWIFGKIIGSALTFGGSFAVATFSNAPRIVGLVVLNVQSVMTSDTSNLTNPSQLTLSPARFLDAATANPIVLAVLSRLDVTVIWACALVAIGYMVAGKSEKGKAIGGAAGIWTLVTLFALWGASQSM